MNSETSNLIVHREMKAETPEWKKEVAEKVKAYGERKKRLTTPPGPIKENETSEPEPKRELTPIPVFKKNAEPVIERYEPEIEEASAADPKPEVHSATQDVQHDSFEVWTEDLDGIEAAHAEENLFTKETPVTPGPYTLRRIAAGLIDHTILIVLWLAFIGGFSVVTHESIDSILKTAWSVTIPVFLLIHCV
jgi:hypothetical protein